jgi:tol-pal system protein YbgF
MLAGAPAVKTSLRLTAVVLAGWLACAAQAALFEDDDARRAILDIRQQTDGLRQEMQRSGEENAQLRRSLLELQSQIDLTRSELATLRGSNEKLSRDLAEVQRQQKDLLQGVDERLRRFEPVKVSVDGREFMAEPAEKREFEAALAIFRKGEFGPAQLAFADFIKRYGQSGYVPSAFFWLGNAQYATREYKLAVQNFRALLTLAPDHLRASEAVLSIANCQLELKDVKGARKTLEDLLKGYPQSEAAATAKERLARLK